MQVRILYAYCCWSWDHEGSLFRSVLQALIFLSRSIFPPYPVDINPTGRNYASGAEDGYVRLHHFDKDYLDMKDPVPEDDEDLSDEEPDSEEENKDTDAKPAAQ